MTKDDRRDLHANGPSDEGGQDRALSEILARWDCPEPGPDFVEDCLLRLTLHRAELPAASADFVDDTMLRLALQQHRVPQPSADFVEDTLLLRALREHRTPEPSPDFVGRVHDAVGATLAEPQPQPHPQPQPVPLATARSPRPIPWQRWAWAGLAAAAVLFALLPLLFPSGSPFRPHGVLDESQAQARFEESLRPEHFASDATNPAARTIALLGDDDGPTAGRIGLPIPRTFETADDASFAPERLPFELGFALTDQ